MNANELMNKIDIPTVFSEKVLSFLSAQAEEEYDGIINLLLCADTCANAYKQLSEQLGEDKYGIKIFAIEIKAAAKAYDNYKKLGISDKIYFDTMRAFRRQLYESYTETNGFIFDRGSWDVRHISLSLFRIGELEYAPDNKYGEDVLAVHIPSDAVMAEENLDASFSEARLFFKKYYPKYANLRITCGSWLLSPRLREFLPEGSKILKFQSRFHIERELGGESCLRWVFGAAGKSAAELDIANLPEDTSLQRGIKAKLLCGESIGSTYGIYKENVSAYKIRLGKYRHYKGNLYEVIAVGRHSESLEEMVVYRALYGEGGVWVRPAYMWLQMVTLPSGAARRFEYIEE